MSFSKITAKPTIFLNNIKKQKYQINNELPSCQISRKSVEKQKSYRSLKLHFFPKKGGKRTKLKLSPLVLIILNNIKKQKNNSINEQQYVKIWDV